MAAAASDADAVDRGAATRAGLAGALVNLQTLLEITHLVVGVAIVAKRCAA